MRLQQDRMWRDSGLITVLRRTLAWFFKAALYNTISTSSQDNKERNRCSCNLRHTPTASHPPQTPWLCRFPPPHPILFYTVIGKPANTYWEAWPCRSQEGIRKWVGVFFPFHLFGSGTTPQIGAKGDTTSSSHSALRSLPTSVPNCRLVGTLKFNADESGLTSWEINVTRTECYCGAAGRNLDL